MRRAAPVTSTTGRAWRTWLPTMRRCNATQGRQCIGAPCAGAIRAAIAARRRLARLRPLHGAGAVRARAWATTPRRAASSARMPASGSDFVTAPELSPLFGRALARQVAQALDGQRQRRGVGVRRRLGRAGRAAARGAGRARAALHHRRPLGRAARSASASGWRAFGDRGALARRAARRDAAAWSSATRCSTRCRCSCCTSTAQRWFERGVALDGEALRLGRPPDRAAPAGRRRPSCPAPSTEIHPQAEAFVAHAGRAAAARRRLLHRLRLPRGRVLPPAAQRRHADVPPRAPRRHRPAGRRRREGHHRARRLHRHRAGRRRTPGCDVLGYTTQARFLMNCGLLELLQGADLRTHRATRRSCSPSTRWASCSR